MTDSSTISDIDLLAYVDDQLDPARRMEVELHLSRHPEAAAAVMFDLHQRSALRLAVAARPLTEAPALERAARGSAVFSGRIAALAASFLLAVGLAVGVGMAPDHLAPTPPYVDDAVQSHRASTLRAQMRSQLETAELEPRELHGATDVRLPALPKGWRVTDVQVYPSDEGPSVQLMIATSERETLSLFAVKAETSADEEPELTTRGGESVAYWEVGDQAFALMGYVPRRDLRDMAADLADNRLL